MVLPSMTAANSKNATFRDSRTIGALGFKFLLIAVKQKRQAPYGLSAD